MVLKGHMGKEIERKVRKCIVEDGLSEEQCLSYLDDQYDLDQSDKDEIKEIIIHYKNL